MSSLAVDWAVAFGTFDFLLLLKELINSSDCGLSPKRFCKWSAASLFERDSVYVIICFSESSSKGRSLDNCGSAQVDRSIFQ